MRKVTRRTVEAFIEGRSLKVSNTESTGNHLVLFDNTIAKREDGRLKITLAGWPTNTTRERLNGLLRLAGSQYRLVQRNGETCLDYGENWRPIEAREWIEVADV